MSKKVIGGRFFDVLNLPNLPQFGPGFGPEYKKGNNLRMFLEDSGHLSLTWDDPKTNKPHRAIVGISMIKHLELEVE